MQAPPSVSPKRQREREILQMQSGLASPLMFVPEIQGAHTLSVLEVSTSWIPYRSADIPNP